MFIHFSKPRQPLQTQISIWTVSWLSQTGGQSVSQSVSQSACQSIPSYFESLGSISGQSKTDLWWMKDHWEMFSLLTKVSLYQVHDGCSILVFHSPITHTRKPQKLGALLNNTHTQCTRTHSNNSIQVIKFTGTRHTYIAKLAGAFLQPFIFNTL